VDCLKSLSGGADNPKKPNLSQAGKWFSGNVTGLSGVIMNALTWADVERLTGGHVGRDIRSVCPFCSAARSHGNQKKKVFAIRLKDPDFAIYNCAHCGESGYLHSNNSRVVDLAEVKRRRAQADLKERNDKQRRTDTALRLWDERKPFFGSPAESYLRSTRAIGDWLSAFARLDEVLGFHPACPFEDKRLPCMLALVRNIRTDEPQAIHRTALTPGPTPDRIDRLSLGPTAGGAIKLSPHDEVTNGLLIGEGIETAFSAALRLKFRPVWSVISRSGLAKFPVLDGVQCLTVAVDNDDSGDGQRDAGILVERMVGAGIEVITTQPNLAKDFNDLVRAAR
jgi:Toprim domain